MGLFSFFGKTAKQTEEEAAAERAKKEDLELYSGMRVEVTSTDGRMFLVAKLQGLRGDRAQLKPSVDGSLMTQSEDPMPVTLRGYSSKEKRAVFLTGTVRLTASGVWQVEHLSLIKRTDDRAHVRVVADAEGTVKLLGRRGVPEETCRLMNISQGGVYISMNVRHEVGDKFVLRVKPYPQAETLVLKCQFLRILERKHGYFEYGCKFIDLKPSEEESVLRCVLELQRRP